MPVFAVAKSCLALSPESQVVLGPRVNPCKAEQFIEALSESVVRAPDTLTISVENGDGMVLSGVGRRSDNPLDYTVVFDNCIAEACLRRERALVAGTYIVKITPKTLYLRQDNVFKDQTEFDRVANIMCDYVITAVTTDVDLQYRPLMSALAAAGDSYAELEAYEIRDLLEEHKKWARVAG